MSIELFQSRPVSIDITVLDENGDAASLVGLDSVRIGAADRPGAELRFTKTLGNGVTVTGANTLQVDLTAEDTNINRGVVVIEGTLTFDSGGPYTILIENVSITRTLLP